MCDVLLLEDHPEVLDLVQAALELRGFTVQVCGTAEAALAYLRSAAPCQAILSDIDLGRGMDGFAVVDEARRGRPGLRALYYSGHARPPAGRGLGENERFLEKPFSRLALFELLAELGVRPGGAAP